MDYQTRVYVDLACFIRSVQKELMSSSGQHEGVVSHQVVSGDASFNDEFDQRDNQHVFDKNIILLLEKHIKNSNDEYIGQEKFFVRFKIINPDFGRSNLRIQADKNADFLVRVDNWDIVLTEHPKQEEGYSPSSSETLKIYFHPILKNILSNKICWRYINERWYFLDLDETNVSI